MKRIVDLKSSHGIHYVNLENLIGSAIFSELGGNATISEGPTISISGQNLQRLEMTQENGVVRLLLHYTTEEGKETTHLLGETDNPELGEASSAWVARVNSIYEN